MNSILMNKIFCKLCRLKKTGIQIFEQSVSRFIENRKHYSHKYGELSNLLQNGWYERKLIGIVSGKIHTDIVRVPCCHFRENGTGFSEAVLPDICISGSSFTMLFVLFVMRDKYMPGFALTNNRICEKYGIAMSTLRRWIRLFKHMMGQWDKILDQYICGSEPPWNLSGECLKATRSEIPEKSPCTPSPVLIRPHQNI